MLGIRLFQKIEHSNQILVEDNWIADLPLYPHQYQQLIINAIKHDNNYEAKKLLTDFIIEIMNHSKIQLHLIESIKQLYDAISAFLVQYHIYPNDYISRDELLDGLIIRFYEDQIIALQEYIHQSFHETDLSLEASAQELGIDQYTLSREFKRIVGINFIEYLTDIRISHAKHLLISSDRKINDVAQQVGYNSSYFNRIFKKKTGLTPGEYRKHYFTKAEE
ncbi:helix-turn-helix transcriptional regulator [Fundicoccus sp. Sow4_H7]|uniref:helix-turn-helix transcriptional regulator n=1 Tax=Fundicoccus sp. Sow4_H7 TaxID=3438784 RepID=UPI003F8EF0C7